ncbi:MAG TPA: AI-2E family transporter [Polyangiaceae bacterium]|nr:AI-2E family transporter [Polyangiaceae bacterium]
MLETPRPPAARTRRIVFLSVSAALALALLVVAREVLLPFIFALFVAYLLTPLVASMERRKVPGWVAVLLTYAVSLGALYGFFSTVTPRMATEVGGLLNELPSMARAVERDWGPRLQGLVRRFGDKPVEEPRPAEVAPTLRVTPHVDGSYDVEMGSGVEVRPVGEGVFRVDSGRTPENPGMDASRLVDLAVSEAVAYGRSNVMTLLSLGQALLAAVSRFIFRFFLTLMLAAYLMLTRERIYNFFRDLCSPPARPSFDDLWARIDLGLSGVVRGQLLICLVNGVLTAIGFWFLNLKYWPVLSLLAAVLSIIPIFGAFLSSVPAVAIGLTQSFSIGLGALVWIVVIHQIEANFLNPKIIGDAAKIHPVLVVFSLLVGEHLFRLPGALLAVPFLSIVQSLFLHFRAVVEGAAQGQARAPLE